MNAPHMTDLPLTLSFFPPWTPGRPAYGHMDDTTWLTFSDALQSRREGEKSGLAVIPATFKPEPDGRVRRLLENVAMRTAIVLDIETSKTTGEIPPEPGDAASRIRALGWCAAIYTSHGHEVGNIRFRVVIPLSAPIAHLLPAPEIVADLLDLDGTLDTSKIGASSLFYLPSAKPGHLADHETIMIDGEPIEAAWMEDRAGAVLAARAAEQGRIRAAAMEAASKRREAKIAAGFDPNSSIIESIRDRLDLAGELIGHGYKPAGDKRYLYPASETGVPGVYTMGGRDGVERVYSHHAADPLAAGNLPSWCHAKAIDVVDVVTILDFSGDQKKALATLANRFGIETPRSADDAQTRKPDPRRQETARAAFRLLRRGIPSDELLTCLHRLNEQRSDPLRRDDIGATALWAARRLKEQANAR
jgi:hypothetical protein